MATQCTTAEEAAIWIVAVIIFVLFSSSIYLITKFVSHMTKQRTKPNAPKGLYWTGLAFFVISSLILLIWPLSAVSYCYETIVDTSSTLILLIIAIFLYFPGQLYFLWRIMFLKTYYTFKESAYALSKCTTRLFIALFVLIATKLSSYMVNFFFTGTSLV